METVGAMNPTLDRPGYSRVQASDKKKTLTNRPTNLTALDRL